MITTNLQPVLGSGSGDDKFSALSFNVHPWNDGTDTPPSSTAQLGLPNKQHSKLVLWKSRCQRQRNKRRDDRNLFFTKPHKQGTLISFRAPSRERVSSWFWGTDPIQFNHPLVGMTNPFWQIATPAGTEDTTDESSHQPHHGNTDTDSTRMRLVSRTPATEKNGNGSRGPLQWWPQGPWKSIMDTGGKDVESFARNNDDTYISKSSSKSNWRILCYRQRVGYGTECYERVKQAALAVDFEIGHKGIVSVLPPRPPKGGAPPYHRFAIRDNEDSTKGVSDVQHHQESNGFLSQIHSSAASSSTAVPIWSGGGRRLATYTRTGPFSWLSIFAVNPVSVVYEIVDQRGGDHLACTVGQGGGCLYSSTAFATCQGHWLCGEERVTVFSRTNEPHAPVDVEILSISKPASSLMGKLTWPLVGRMQNTFFVQQLKALERAAEKKGPSVPTLPKTESSIDQHLQGPTAMIRLDQ